MEAISTADAPKVVGPYSQAVVHKGTVYCSGQISIDSKTGKVIKGSVAEQIRICLLNLKAVLESTGSSLEKILSIDIAVSSMAVFDVMNQAYTDFFPPRIRPG